MVHIQQLCVGELTGCRESRCATRRERDRLNGRLQALQLLRKSPSCPHEASREHNSEFSLALLSPSSGWTRTSQMSVVRQCRSALLRHTSRAHNVAAVDRYSAIHTFFSSQQNTPRIGVVPQRQYTRLHYRLPGDTNGEDAYLCVRRFSWTCTRRAEDPSKGVSEATKEKAGSSSSGATTKAEPPNPLQYDNYPPFFRRLALSLPTHRPTREDFLNAANGFWQRARVRFRWLTIRSFRKYNADDISAFVTWFVMSQTLWLFIGTCVWSLPQLSVP